MRAFTFGLCPLLALLVGLGQLGPGHMSIRAESMAPPGEVTVGEVAPEIAGKSLDGKELKLSDFRGKVVLLVFWFKSCGPCLAEVPHLKDLLKQHKGKPFVILGVNNDEDGEAARTVAAKEGMTWPSFADGDKGLIVKKWRVNGWPTLFLLDENGVVRYDNDYLSRIRFQDGPDGKLVPFRRLDDAIEELLKKTVAERPLYHADPEHLWNRLHTTLFVRVGPDGRAYGQDRLEPLLWLESTHLLEEKSNKRAVALLEEFLKGKGEKLVEDPQKRALLQRDLWLVFNWLESDHWLHQKLKEEEVRAARDRLRRPLAAVIGRLALTPDQIKKLPDNYAAAVASGEFAKRFDPEHPDKPYLPAELFAADGPWVCLGRPDGPIAPTHLRDDATNPYTNSAFLLFLRLPAGRSATVEYLKQLRSFDQPLRVEAKDKKLLEKYLPNPKLPPFPAGTEVALVRRALLIDSSNTPIATALTESVQIRMYRDIPEMTEQALKAALDSNARTNQRARSWQSFQEFQLSRSRLFAGKAGGLRAVGPDDRDFHSPFSLSYHDEFDSPKDSPRDQPFSERTQFPVKADCFQCHSLPGVASFNSYFNSRTHLSDRDATARPFSLSETPVSEVAEAAVKWKAGRPNWTALRKLLAE